MAKLRGGPSRPPSAWACVLILLLGWSSSIAYDLKPVPLVLPLESRSQLAVQQEGLALLNSIPGPVSPVVVIGPYRSGKSFTLNQLLGVPCNQGFGVGHTRVTETKGIWLWGTPIPRHVPGEEPTHGSLEAGDGESMLLYIDTEGFESTGKSNSYDDRIFALSALLSSLLIYNLPETIRESDVSKLSFAVELARGFFDKEQQQQQEAGAAEQPGKGGAGAADGEGEGGGGASVDPGSMLWLIQRDFLQGQTADQLVRSVLQPVPNPQNDPGLAALNQIRTSLSSLARNSTGFSLRQPHLDRARLCDIPDNQLDPEYVRQREALKSLVVRLAQPKALAGRPMTGPQLARLVGRMVEALNEQEIPTATSLLAAFNRDVLARCAANYTAELAGVALPVNEDALDAVELGARDRALKMLKALQIGPHRLVDMRAELVKELERAYQVRRTENLAASNTLCSELENKCETELDTMQNMRLPSLRKFESSHRHCERTFLERCRGPAKGPNAERLEKAWVRARKAFGKDYNDRLFTGLLIASLAAAVVFRFVLRVQLLELGAWAAFLFLEVYPKLHPVGSMYDSKGWALTVRLWELAMVILFGFSGSGVFWLVVAVVLVVMRFVYFRKRRRGGGGGGGLSGSGGSGGGAGAGGGGAVGLLGASTRRKNTPAKDLDV